MGERVRVSGCDARGCGSTLSMTFSGIPKEMEQCVRLVTEGLYWMSVVNQKLVVRSTTDMSVEHLRPIKYPSATRLRDHEREIVIQYLIEMDYNQSAVARILGVSRPTIARKIKAYGIVIPECYKHNCQKEELQEASVSA